MTRALGVLDALALVPDWDPTKADVEVLHGGLTNRSYQIAYGGEQFVLRLSREQSSATWVDRSLESVIHERAYAAGLAPQIVFADADAGVMLRRYLPGRVWNREDLASRSNLEALADILRRVHKLPVTGHFFATESYATAYGRAIEAASGVGPFARTCIEIVGCAPSPDDVVCSHNDIVAENVIASSGLQLIDWEYAADNDPMFDLASAIGYHDLSKECGEHLLNVYVGHSSVEKREQLASQRRVFDALNWLWLAARNSVAPNAQQTRRLTELQRRLS